MQIIAKGLREERICVGDISERGFHIWEGGVDAVMKRLELLWPEDGQLEVFGEICWFDLPGQEDAVRGGGPLEYSSVDEVIAAYRSLQIPLGEVPDLIMQFVRNDNVDQIVDALPPKIKEAFIREARSGHAGRFEPAPLIFPPGAPDRIPREAYLAINDWLARHPADD